MAEDQLERQPAETQNTGLEAEERTTQVLFEFVNAERGRLDQPPVRLRELTPQQNERMESWIKDLASNDFRTREAATEGLTELGIAALPRLQQAAKATADLEVRFRLDSVISGHLRPGLIDIDNQWGNLDAPAAAGDLKRLNNRPIIDFRQELESDLNSARRFADDSALPPDRRQNFTANRINDIDQLLEQQRQGKLELPEDKLEMLNRERQNLSNITKVCAALEVELAQVCLSNGESMRGKELLTSALRRDASLFNSENVKWVIWRHELDKDDAFVRQYKELGGSDRALKEYSREQMENERRSREKFDGGKKAVVPENVPLAFDLSIWPSGVGV